MKAISRYILAMLIFGTTGIVVHYINLPSCVIALGRAATGIVFLVGLMFATKKKINWGSIKKNLPFLIVSGVLLGINWVLLFEAFRYTSVATATLCTYIAPAIIILVSPVVLGENLTIRKLMCVAIAILGMSFVSGFFDVGISGGKEFKGVILSLIYAVFFAAIVLLNKKITGLSGYELTLVQIGCTLLILIPYTFITQDIASLEFPVKTIVPLIYLGIMNSGVVYALYFGALTHIQAQTAAILSYIDPVVAVVLSALVLHEDLSLMGKLGAVMILGSMMVSEFFDRKP